MVRIRSLSELNLDSINQNRNSKNKLRACYVQIKKIKYHILKPFWDQMPARITKRIHFYKDSDPVIQGKIHNVFRNVQVVDLKIKDITKLPINGYWKPHFARMCAMRYIMFRIEEKARFLEKTPFFLRNTSDEPTENFIYIEQGEHKEIKEMIESPKCVLEKIDAKTLLKQTRSLTKSSNKRQLSKRKIAKKSYKKERIALNYSGIKKGLKKLNSSNRVFTRTKPRINVFQGNTSQSLSLGKRRRVNNKEKALKKDLHSTVCAQNEDVQIISHKKFKVSENSNSKSSLENGDVERKNQTENAVCVSQEIEIRKVSEENRLSTNILSKRKEKEEKERSKKTNNSYEKEKIVYNHCDDGKGLERTTEITAESRNRIGQILPNQTTESKSYGLNFKDDDESNKQLLSISEEQEHLTDDEIQIVYEKIHMREIDNSKDHLEHDLVKRKKKKKRKEKHAKKLSNSSLNSDFSTIKDKDNSKGHLKHDLAKRKKKKRKEIDAKKLSNITSSTDSSTMGSMNFYENDSTIVSENIDDDEIQIIDYKINIRNNENFKNSLRNSIVNRETPIKNAEYLLQKPDKKSLNWTTNFTTEHSINIFEEKNTISENNINEKNGNSEDEQDKELNSDVVLNSTDDEVRMLEKKNINNKKSLNSITDFTTEYSNDIFEEEKESSNGVVPELDVQDKECTLDVQQKQGEDIANKQKTSCSKSCTDKDVIKVVKKISQKNKFCYDQDVIDVVNKLKSVSSSGKESVKDNEKNTLRKSDCLGTKNDFDYKEKKVCNDKDVINVVKMLKSTVTSNVKNLRKKMSSGKKSVKNKKNTHRKSDSLETKIAFKSKEKKFCYHKDIIKRENKFRNAFSLYYEMQRKRKSGKYKINTDNEKKDDDEKSEYLKQIEAYEAKEKKIYKKCKKCNNLNEKPLPKIFYSDTEKTNSILKFPNQPKQRNNQQEQPNDSLDTNESKMSKDNKISDIVTEETDSTLEVSNQLKESNIHQDQPNVFFDTNESEIFMDEDTYDIDTEKADSTLEVSSYTKEIDNQQGEPNVSFDAYESEFFEDEETYAIDTEETDSTLEVSNQLKQNNILQDQPNVSFDTKESEIFKDEETSDIVLNFCNANKLVESKLDSFIKLQSVVQAVQLGVAETIKFFNEKKLSSIVTTQTIETVSDEAVPSDVILDNSEEVVQSENVAHETDHNYAACSDELKYLPYQEFDTINYNFESDNAQETQFCTIDDNENIQLNSDVLMQPVETLGEQSETPPQCPLDDDQNVLNNDVFMGPSNKPQKYENITNMFYFTDKGEPPNKFPHYRDPDPKV